MDNQKSSFKWVVLTVGTLFGIAHIGVLGHLINKNNLPIINLPVGDYTSYSVDAGKDGYRIEYNANDPKVLGVRKHLDKKNGFFGIGGNTHLITEEEYTMDGARHMGGGVAGKLTAQNVECIKAEGAGESTGKMVGASIGAAAAPWFTSIPYVGWLVSGWVVMLGQDKGADIGGELATTMIEGCDEL
jgi:hypothetical protein|tara:strand:- start:570 stop:1130 length:561 start_codon:yes stop_codon:yes gene_type:complete